jgi:hypothetical protein
MDLIPKEDAVKWFLEKQRGRLYKYAATANCYAVKATDADNFGPNRSIVLNEGIRTFLFLIKRDRDAFCRTFRAKPAPLPVLETPVAGRSPP